MSRIGKLPIQLPKDVNINYTGSNITVKGKFGSLQTNIPNVIEVVENEKILTVKLNIPETVSVEINQNTTINLKSCDKELLGLFAANIRSWRRPEPYKGKGILYKDEQIIRKAGKSGK